MVTVLGNMLSGFYSFQQEQCTRARGLSCDSSLDLSCRVTDSVWCCLTGDEQ